MARGRGRPVPALLAVLAVLLAALVVHSALEGVALGVTQSTRDLWGIAVAILSHKARGDGQGERDGAN